MFCFSTEEFHRSPCVLFTSLTNHHFVGIYFRYEIIIFDLFLYKLWALFKSRSLNLDDYLDKGPSLKNIQFLGHFLTYPLTHIRFSPIVMIVLEYWYPIFENLLTYLNINHPLWMAPKVTVKGPNSLRDLPVDSLRSHP